MRLAPIALVLLTSFVATSVLGATITSLAQDLDKIAQQKKKTPENVADLDKEVEEKNGRIAKLASWEAESRVAITHPTTDDDEYERQFRNDQIAKHQEQIQRLEQAREGQQKVADTHNQPKSRFLAIESAARSGGLIEVHKKHIDDHQKWLNEIPLPPSTPSGGSQSNQPSQAGPVPPTGDMIKQLSRDIDIHTQSLLRPPGQGQSNETREAHKTNQSEKRQRLDILAFWEAQSAKKNLIKNPSDDDPAAALSFHTKQVERHDEVIEKLKEARGKHKEKELERTAQTRVAAITALARVNGEIAVHEIHRATHQKHMDILKGGGSHSEQSHTLPLSQARPDPPAGGPPSLPRVPGIPLHPKPPPSPPLPSSSKRLDRGGSHSEQFHIPPSSQARPGFLTGSPPHVPRVSSHRTLPPLPSIQSGIQRSLSLRQGPSTGSAILPPISAFHPAQQDPNPRQYLHGSGEGRPPVGFFHPRTLPPPGQRPLAPQASWQTQPGHLTGVNTSPHPGQGAQGFSQSMPHMLPLPNSGQPLFPPPAGQPPTGPRTGLPAELPPKRPPGDSDDWEREKRQRHK